MKLSKNYIVIFIKISFKSGTCQLRVAASWVP